MVSNFERILHEIREGSRRIDQNSGLDPEDIVTLIMNIVDLEDSNRVKAVAGINQKIKGMIENAVRRSSTREGA